MVPAEQAALRRSQPDAVAGILVNRQRIIDLLIHVSFIGASSYPACCAPARPDPYRSITGFPQGNNIHRVVHPGLFLRRGKPGNRIVIPQRSVPNAEPQTVADGTFQARDHLVAKRKFVGQLEQLEFKSIKPDQADLCSQPQKAIRGLADGVDPVCRQAVFALPGVAIVLEDIFAGIQGTQGQGQQDTPASRYQFQSHGANSLHLGYATASLSAQPQDFKAVSLMNSGSSFPLASD